MSDSSYMNKAEGVHLAHLILIGMVCMVLLIGYVFYQSWDHRMRLVDAQRVACERAKKDRIDNAQGWRFAEGTLLASKLIEEAKKYDRIADNLERRAGVDCSKAFPKTGFGF